VQVRPPVQAGFEPHRQLPLEQLSALVGSHVLLPHLHWPPEQLSTSGPEQGPLMVPHTQLPLPLQVSLRPEQVAHTWPPLPHAVALLPERQVLPPWQQPEQPVEVSHTQEPPLQRVPDPQGEPEPQ